MRARGLRATSPGIRRERPLRRVGPSLETRLLNAETMVVYAALGLPGMSADGGEVPERPNGTVSKTVVPLTGDREFESPPLRQSP